MARQTVAWLCWLGCLASRAHAQFWEPASMDALVKELERAWASVQKAAPTEAAPAPAPAGQSFYRYVAPDGRTVYTNVEEQVPIEQRFAARLDLSRVSLNTEIGNELERRLQHEHRELAHTPYCKQKLADADQSFWSRLFAEYGPLIVCGGLLGAFLLFTPSALRRYGGPVWAKTLMMAIPALAVAGVMTFTMTRTGRAVSDFKRLAAPCSEQTFAALARYENPVLKHAQLLELLKQQIARAEDR